MIPGLSWVARKVGRKLATHCATNILGWDEDDARTLGNVVEGTLTVGLFLLGDGLDHAISNAANVADHVHNIASAVTDKLSEVS